MKTKTAKELRGLVNKGLDLTLKEIEAMKPEAYKLMLEATKELVTRNIKATDKEQYQMFLETLEEYAPAGLSAPEAPEKVANKKAPTKPEKPAKTEKEKPAKTEKPEKPKKVKPFNKVKVNDTVQFQVEGEEVKHDIKILYKGKNNIIAIMKEDEREVFNIRKADFNKGIFNWKDRHGEEYNIMVTL